MKHMFANAWGYPPVNVEELDDRYEILLYAAGYAKSDFKKGSRASQILESP